VNDLHWMTVAEAAGAIAARNLSPVELMEALLHWQAGSEAECFHPA